MPAIRQFEAPELGLRPTERGVEATAAAARRVQGAYNEGAASIKEVAENTIAMGRSIGNTVANVGEVAVKAIEHQEVSKGSAELAKLHMSATQQYNERIKNADPNDLSVGPKYLDEVLNPALDKFQGAFMTEGGQKWAEARVSSLRLHMADKMEADQATMAGQAIAVNLEQTKNALSSTVRSDPSSVRETLGQWESTVKELVRTSPALTGVQSAKIQGELTQHGKSEIVKSALIGMAAINPAAATKAVESGQYAEYISGADAKAIIANAQQQVRAQRVDETYARHNNDLQRRQVSEAAENEVLKRVYSDDPKVMGQVSTKSIVNDDRLSNPTKEKLIRLVEREMKPESDAKVSARTSLDLFARIALPDGDPRKLTSLDDITQARIDGKLTKADYNDLRREYTEARTPQGEKLSKDREDFLKRWAPMIDGGFSVTGMHSMLGTQKTYEFQSDARRQEEDLRKRGLDPHLVYDPRSEYFFGKMENIAKYRVSMQQTQAYEATLKSMDKARDTNLTAGGSTVTGVEVINQKPGEKTFVPPSNWQFSPSRQQYRDPNGTFYDVAGKRVQ
jgi:hypothetical protein